jgi:hypothetical protein
MTLNVSALQDLYEAAVKAKRMLRFLGGRIAPSTLNALADNLDAAIRKAEGGEQGCPCR